MENAATVRVKIGLKSSVMEGGIDLSDLPRRREVTDSKTASKEVDKQNGFARGGVGDGSGSIAGQEVDAMVVV